MIVVTDFWLEHLSMGRKTNGMLLYLVECSIQEESMVYVDR